MVFVVAIADVVGDGVAAASGGVNVLQQLVERSCRSTHILLIYNQVTEARSW